MKELSYLSKNCYGIRVSSHGYQVLVPSPLRSIRAISAVESMGVGTYHFTQGPKSPSSKYDMNAYKASLFGSDMNFHI